MTPPASPIEWMQALDLVGVDWRSWALASARCAPVVLIVPAFGLRALPRPMRAAMTLALATTLVPIVGPVPGEPMALGRALVWQAMQGLPIAIAAAVPLWAATMAGGLVDLLRGGRESLDVPVVDSRTGALGVLWSLMASTLFLTLGGPARVMEALTHPVPLSNGALLRAVSDLTGGVHIAVAIAAPWAVAALIVETAGALWARAVSPAPLGSTIAVARSVACLALAGVLFDRVARLLAQVATSNAK